MLDFLACCIEGNALPSKEDTYSSDISMLSFCLVWLRVVR